MPVTSMKVVSVGPTVGGVSDLKYGAESILEFVCLFCWQLLDFPIFINYYNSFSSPSQAWLHWVGEGCWGLGVCTPLK